MNIINRNHIQIGDTVIYDIFPVTESRLVAIGPYIKENINSIFIYDCGSKKKSDPSIIIHDSHRHTLIIEFEFNSGIFNNNCADRNIVLFDGVNTIQARINCAVNCEKCCSLSTLTIENPTLIMKWINYHRENYGIDRFYIYSNTREHFDKFISIAEKSEYSDVITCILWDVPYYYPNTSISGQTTQQNHSIYRFRRNKIIGFFDVDEFIIFNGQDLKSLICDLIEDTHIMQGDRIIKPNFAAVSLQCLLFGRQDECHENYDVFLHKMVRCAAQLEKKWERQKCFVNPNGVKVFSVHMVVDGGATLCLSPEIARFNHYFMLNKPDIEYDHEKYSASENYDIQKFI